MKIFEWLLKNQLTLPITALIIVGGGVIALWKVLNSGKNIDTKLVKINNPSVTIPDRRDNTTYFFYIEKIVDCKDAIYRIKEILIQKQSEVFKTNFLYLNNCILDCYVTGYFAWLSKCGIEKPSKIETTPEYLKYSLIIKEITEDNITNIHHYVKDNDLWKYTEKEWIQYKNRNAKKYMEQAKEKFKMMYDPITCKIPTLYHSLEIMKPCEKKLLVIIDAMQEELRVNSCKAQKEIKKIKSALKSYKQFQEPGNGS